jgi:6,7-dimethyl-8-ribityllumazine synthase
MPRILEGDLLARDLRLAVVISRFNDFITGRLLEGALDAIRRHDGQTDDLPVAYVSGSYELPVVAKRLAQRDDIDAVICLGCVIRGSTGHYDHVANEAAKGIGQAALEIGKPIIFGVITADSLEQAIERAGTKQGNAGAKAALSAIEMANLMKKID